MKSLARCILPQANCEQSRVGVVMRTMSSCYGSDDAVNTKVSPKEIYSKCSYLPLTATVTLNEKPVKIELAPFRDEEVVQGLKLMNDVITEGKSWPFQVSIHFRYLTHHYFEKINRSSCTYRTLSSQLKVIYRIFILTLHFLFGLLTRIYTVSLLL